MKVSLTIVTRNRSAELAQALRSVEKQSEAVAQIVVVDNASDDDTVAMLQRDFPRVQVIRLQENAGCQPARNMAMEKCHGDIIFNMDDDGTLHPDAVRNAMECFEKHPEVGLIAASVRVPPEKASSYPHHNDKEDKHYTSFFIGAAHALRRQVLTDAGYFPDYFRGHSESDLSLRIMHSGWEMLYHPEVIMYHHISQVERNRNTETCYQIRHQLETSVRLQPALTAWSQVLWRIAQGFAISIPKGVFPGYLKGLTQFLFSLPDSLKRRKPVSKEASRKHHYLKHHPVRDLAELPDFKRYGFIQMLRSRFTAHKRKNPAHEDAPGGMDAGANTAGADDPGEVDRHERGAATGNPGELGADKKGESVPKSKHPHNRGSTKDVPCAKGTGTSGPGLSGSGRSGSGTSRSGTSGSGAHPTKNNNTEAK